jgi:hypothetical protein
MAKGHPLDAPNFDPVGDHVDGPDISSAVTLTAPTGATKIMIQAVTQNIRYTLDGTAPTTSVGFLLKADDPAVILPLGNNTTIKVIQVAATADLQYLWGSG